MRLFIRPKLLQHSRLYKIFSVVHKLYYSLTGFSHVLPDFYIIGAAKSGTSSLYEYLIQHPQIYPALTKEPRFFDKYYSKGLNWYRVQFPFKIHKFFMTNLFNTKFLTGEATVRYLDHPLAPKRIKSVTPKAKFIVLLRNPIDRAYSHYNMMVSGNKENLSFEEAIRHEKNRTSEGFEKMKMNNDYYSSEYYHHAYLDRSIYVKKLEDWVKEFSKEQFLVLSSENFFKEPEITYKRILTFLEAKDWKLRKYKKIGEGKYKQPQIEPKLKQELIEFFRPYNKKLYNFLGINFKWDD